MKSIQNIIQSNGVEFLDNLMNDYLVVYEKLSASTLSFRRVGNVLKFYKGRDNEEITPLNETLYTYFKCGIEYIRRVSLIFYMEFPEGWLFRTQYFNPNNQGLVQYEQQPQNNLVLSCIDTGNSIIEDASVLKKWADRLQIDIENPIFIGFLSEFQKEKLMEYVNGNVDCGDISFSQYIISLLSPGITHSAYSDVFNTYIDSFIFKFYKSGSKKCVSLKLVDPYMEELVKQNKDKFGTNYGTENEIILANFVAWLQTVDMKDIDIEGDSDDDRYFDLICKLFNKYVKKEKKILKELNSDINESYSVNIDKVKNKETSDILKNNPNMTNVFQVIVGSFMNRKDDDYDSMSIMDSGLKDLFNKEVSSIKRLTSVEDNQVKSFTELIRSSMNPETDKDIDADKVLSFDELMDKIGYSEQDSDDGQSVKDIDNDTEKSDTEKSDIEKEKHKKEDVEKSDNEKSDAEKEEPKKEDTEKDETEKADTDKEESKKEETEKIEPKTSDTEKPNNDKSDIDNNANKKQKDLTQSDKKEIPQKEKNVSKKSSDLENSIKD